jgi:multidrug resistance efflux pump
LATLQAKQARKALDAIQEQIAQQRAEFNAAKAKIEQERATQEMHRVALARLKDDEDALAVLLS